MIVAALWLTLMSGLTLAQTGRLATQGRAVAQLQRRQTLLLREQSNLRLRLACAQSLADIERRALQMNLRPMRQEQARHITISATVDRESPLHDGVLLNP